MVGLVDVVGPDEAGIGVVGNGVLEPNGGLIVPALGLIIVVGTDEVGIGDTGQNEPTYSSRFGYLR